MTRNDILHAYKEGKITTQELREKLHALTNNPVKKPLSEGQKGLWTLYKMSPQMSAYNIPLCFRISQKLDIEAFQLACQFLVQQYPILTTIFGEDDGVPYQTTQPAGTIQLQQESISNLEQTEFISHLKEISKKPFSLEEGPLIRINLFFSENSETILLITIHHIIFDGSSIIPLLTALINAYLDYSQDRKPILTDIADYNEFVEWEQSLLSSNKGKQFQSYWKHQLSNELPTLELPSDYSRPPFRDYKGRTYETSLTLELSRQIKSFSQSHQVNPSVVFLAIFKTLLYRYTYQQDIIVGMPTMGRSQERFSSSLGYFINMIPIRSKEVGSRAFVDFLQELQFTLADGLDNAEYPFPAIVREVNIPRANPNAPVFQVTFAYQNFFQASGSDLFRDRFNDIFNMELLDWLHQEGEYEFELEVYERDTDGFLLKLKFDPDLFSLARIERMMEHYVTLVTEAIKAPQLKLGEFSFLSVEEEQKILSEWNDTQTDYPREKCVHELFEEQVRKTPDNIALIFENKSLTYRELDERSTKLAIFLQQNGVKPEALIGICVERSIEMMVALLGVLKSGGAYVPLDPDYPAERLEYMIEDSNIMFLLTQSKLMDTIAGLTEGKCATIRLDGDWKQIEKEASSAGALKREVTSANLVYVMYTSGSTGKPKGVMLEHRALTNRLTWMIKKYNMSEADRVLQKTPFSFDVCGWEFYCTLMAGARLIMAQPEKHKDPAYIMDIVQQEQITYIHFVPSMLQAFLSFENVNKCTSLKKVFCSGEALTVKQNELFFETFKNQEMHNLYGPTEAAIEVSYWECYPGVPAIPIGKPISNTQLHIINEHQVPSPIGIPGELCIAGVGLARGYMNRPELTAEKFVDNPFQPGTKMYKTGDLVRWSKEGNIEYLGRIDYQVKVRGFRIELGEIEKQLNTHPDIHDCIVVVKERGEQKQLIAYYVPKKSETSKDIESRTLRTYLNGKLPGYMIPANFVSLDAIPLLPNGKANRKELMQRDVVFSKPGQKTLPQSETEKKILDIWKKVLHVSDIGVEDGFFEVGGDSILAVTVVNRINKFLDCDIKMATLFEYSNIKELASYISDIKLDVSNNPSQGTGADDRVIDPIAAEPIEKPDFVEHSDYPAYYQNSVAVIGISCLFPGASDQFKFWENLCHGKESIRFFSEDELRASQIPEEVIKNPNYVPLQSPIEGKDYFDPGFFNISANDASLMDPQFRLLLMHSWNAFEDAGYVPKRFPKTGVFMSAGNNFYQTLLNDLNGHQEQVMDDPNQYVGWILSQGGTIPTMISHKLGLTGPSFFVHSNCSSSMVGLSSAFKSITSGESDYALVGAASVIPTDGFGYIHRDGLNFSSDGHCKAFDESADGMIPGEGVAVILLKNAINAVEDGDRIYSLIRGIAVNNDGADKVGFYAPSVKGQATVIEEVLQLNAINPEQISYIEAHGTGTKLGDPIELSALGNVYKKFTDKKQFCGIGSVKTNIGHLDTAAGLAGCIKIALSLYHGEIPPSINFQNPNPEIDIENSPFFVVDTPSKLEWQESPHLAALSSFGLGGTNTHAIFEQFHATQQNHAQEAADTASKSYMVPLSAKSKDRLYDYAERLLEFLRGYLNRNANSTRYPGKQIDFSLADLSYTLQVGRETMESKVVFIVDRMEDLVQKLEAFIRREISIESCFQNVDASYGSDSKFLENDEDAEELIQKWVQKGKLHKLAEAWLKGLQFDWDLLSPQSKPQRISLPTYPFARERYQPLQVGDASSSLVKPLLIKDHLHPLLQDNISDFNEQKFKTILTGQEFFLKDHLIKGQKVLPAVAYLEMAREALTRSQPTADNSHFGIKLLNIVWASPLIVQNEPAQINISLYPENSGRISFEIFSPGFSAEEGQKLHSQGYAVFEEMEAHDVDLPSLQNVCNETSFSSAEIYNYFKTTGFNYGPGFQGIEKLSVGNNQVLAKLALSDSVVQTQDQFVLHPGLVDAAIQASVGLILDVIDTESVKRNFSSVTLLPFALQELSILSSCPASIWSHVRYSNDNREGSNIQKLDIDLIDESGNICVSIKGFSSRIADNRSLSTPSVSHSAPEFLLLQPTWHEQPADIQQATPGHTQHFLLLCEAGESLAQELKQKMNDCQLFSLDSEKINIGERFGDYTSRLFEILQGIIKGKPKENVLIQVIIPDREESQLFFGLGGMLSSACQEHPKLNGQIIALDTNEMPDSILNKIKESSYHSSASRVRYQNGKRCELSWNDADAHQNPLEAVWKNHGTYLITGGAGGLGLIFAREITRKIRSGNIILIGRSQLDNEKEDLVYSLQENENHVMYRSVDVAEQDEVMNLIEDISQRFGGLDGIIHSAGVLRDSFILKKEAADLEKVLAPKVTGVVNLDQATKDLKLDHFILFSSIAAGLGSPGQSDYAAANSFLDAFAHYRNLLLNKHQRHGHTLSICWPLWQEGGMQVKTEYQQAVSRNSGMVALPSDLGIRAFYQAFSSRTSQVTVFSGDSSQLRNGPDHSSPSTSTASETIVSLPSVKENTLVNRDADIDGFLKQAVSKTFNLEFNDVDFDTEFEEFGLDPVNLNAFLLLVNDEYQVEFTIDDLLSHSSLNKLSSHLTNQVQRYKPAVQETEKPLPSIPAMTASVKPQIHEKSIQYFKELLSPVIKLPVDKIQPEVPMEKYGIDSVMVVKLNEQLEQVFGPLSKTLFFEYQNINELTAYFVTSHREKLVNLLGTEETPALFGHASHNRKNTATLDIQNGKRKNHRRFSSTRVMADKEQPSQGLNIAIIGLSGRYPKAGSVSEFWENLKNGRDCITEVPKNRWDHDLFFDEDKHKPGKTYSKWGGFLDGADKFDPLFFNISPLEAMVLDPQERIFLECAYETIEDAGYTRETLGSYQNFGLDGNIGVYVGVMYEEYQLYGAQEAVKGRPLALSGSPSSIANRVSYFCNFHGPSMAVDTMCSSSLTTIHLACQAIKQGECRMAIAGGVNLTLHPNKYLMLAQGKFASSNGRCESFGRGGDGYVPGEGVGAVLLKPLSEAVTDGDHIYGVIKATAVNHGGKTNGYSVPNPNAQASLVGHAFKIGNIDPRTISYLEAHGTGTALGDPIEITGLTKAFGEYTTDTQYCAIGSAKSNIGHCESAAGIAGVTKVLMQIKHQQLVPSIHSDVLNPNIDFESSPFTVQRSLAPWNRPQVSVNGQTQVFPRIAGISSFGAGGANAHVVIEEYIPEEDNTASISFTTQHSVIILLSAATEEQLKQQAQRLRTAIDEQDITDDRLADLAYTLQIGREPLKERLAMIVISIDDIKTKLEIFLQGNELAKDMFQGQENQNREHVAAFETDEDLQNVLDVWLGKRKYKKLLDLWVTGLSIDWTKLYQDTRPKKISLPTYPFARERFWIPEIDFDGDHEALPKAPAASVLHPLVHHNISNFTSQRFSSTFSGQEFFLKDHVIKNQKVLPAVAYLEMALTAINQATDRSDATATSLLLQEVTWIRPIILTDNPIETHIIVSPPADNNIVTFEITDGGDNSIIHCQGTGQCVAVNDKAPVDLETWKHSCNQSVLNADQIYEIYHSMGIEYGPAHRGIQEIYVGQDQALVKIQLPGTATKESSNFTLHPSLMDAALQGVIGLMQGVNGTTNPQKPILPFALREAEIRNKCSSTMWAFLKYSEGSSPSAKVPKINIDICNDQGDLCIKFKGFASRVLEGEIQTSQENINVPGLKQMTAVWEEVKPETTTDSQPTATRALIVGGTDRQISTVSQRFSDYALLEVKPSAGIRSLKERLESIGRIDHIIWIAPYHSLASAVDSALIEKQNTGVVCCFRLIKALLALGYDSKELEWNVITTQTQSVLKSEMIDPTHAGLYGLIGSMSKEYPNWKVRLADFDIHGEWPLDTYFSLPMNQDGNAWGYRNRQWYQQQLIPVSYQPLDQSIYRYRGVYVVVGGAGGIGVAWSEYMIRRYQAQIVWIGRKKSDADIQAKLSRLSNDGPAPLYLSADASDLDSLTVAYKEIKSRFSEISGIIHSAIVLLDKTLENMDENRFQAALSAKVNVSIRMAQVFRQEPLDFFLFFSSMNTFFMPPGQSNYSAGCTFKDAFAGRLSHELPCAVKVINWGFWGSVGIVASKAYRERMALSGIGSIEPPEAMAALENLLSNPVDQIALIKTTKPMKAEGISSNERIIIASENHAPMLSLLKNRAEKRIIPKPYITPEEASQMKQMDGLLGKLMWSQLQSIGLFTKKKQSREELKSGSSIQPMYYSWMDESLRVLLQLNYFQIDGNDCLVKDTTKLDINETWQLWNREKRLWLEDNDKKALITLLEATMQDLPQILTGEKAATDVIFPNGSMELVEGMYKHNRTADFFNEVLADKTIAYLEELKNLRPDTRLKIIEIGAGTGGTSAMVLSKLQPYRELIAEYCYTDISKSFLNHAERTYGPDNPFLSYRLFDVSKSIDDQELPAGEYDIAIAANVLHATGNIRETLRNTKAVLKKNGLLLMNELHGNALFSHLTFGLLKGWWLYEDPGIRIPGSPALSSENWEIVLKSEGFQNIYFPALDSHEMGQQIIAAESDGVIRRKLTSSVLTKPAFENTSKLQEKEIFKTGSLKEKSIAYLKSLLSDTLKVPENRIDISDSLDKYGLDSILAMEINNKLKPHFSELSKTLFFEYGSVQELADYFLTNQKESLEALFNKETSSTGTNESPSPDANTSSNQVDTPIRQQSELTPAFIEKTLKNIDHLPPQELDDITSSVDLRGIDYMDSTGPNNGGDGDHKQNTLNIDQDSINELLEKVDDLSPDEVNRLLFSVRADELELK